MRRLLINGLAEQPVIALAEHNEIIGLLSSSLPDRACALDEAFRSLGVTGDIGQIVTIIGPGNYTAIRAGIGFARGLALGFGIDAVGLNMLELDANILGLQEGLIARDARGGQVYLAKISSGQIVDVTLCGLEEISRDNLYSADVKAPSKISIDKGEVMNAMLELVLSGAGQTPARAFYIRDPKAAPSRIPTPRLLG